MVGGRARSWGGGAALQGALAAHPLFCWILLSIHHPPSGPLPRPHPHPPTPPPPHPPTPKVNPKDGKTYPRYLMWHPR
jgi:hypothetical protein